MATCILLEIIAGIIPDTYLSLFYSVLFVVGSLAGLSVFNWLGVMGRSPVNNDVAGFFFGVISLIYSLILAFVIVAVWENYEDLDKTIESETDKLNSILAHSSTLPHGVRREVTTAVSAYCRQVINTEWRMKPRQDAEQPSAIPHMRLMLLKMKPGNPSEQAVMNVIDTDLSAISDLRRSRLNHNRSHVPYLVWLILEAGSVMLVVFSYFFEVASPRLKRIYLFFLAGCIAMCMFLAYSLDHPFTGRAIVSKQPFERVLAEVEQMYTTHP